jgi:phenylacetate-CoA ligase
MSLYSRFLENVLQPAYDLAKGRGYSRYEKFLEKSQWWSRDRLLEHQMGELRKLVSHAYETSAFYEARFRALGAEPGDIRTFEHFRRLPPLDRVDVNGRREELKSSRFAESELIAHATGGSSGTPTRFLLNRDSYDWRTAATTRAYSWCGYRMGEPTLFLWGAPIGEVKKSKARKTDWHRILRRETVVNTFQQDETLWKSVVETIRRKKPRFLVGYVSSVESFSRYLLDTGTKIERPPEAIIGAAEASTPEFIALAERAIGARVFETYGSREFMSIGAACPQHEGMHVNMENILVETEGAPEDGPSELLITDLHNYGMPFLRYRIGDIGTLIDQNCACGRQLIRIGSVDGRVADVLRDRNGRIVPGLFWPHLMKDIPEIGEFQVEQKTLDHIVVHVVLTRALSESSAGLMKREIDKIFGGGMRVEIVETDGIPRRASGKKRVTVGLPA